MSVTLEVSQLEISVLKFVKSRKSQLTSVMAETSQSAIGPYVSVAAVGFASNARTAVCREALVVKVLGGDGGGAAHGSSTTKDSLPCLVPLAKAKVFPKPGAAHSARFQPSPYASAMIRVHVAPSATANGTPALYGAPPSAAAPSEQLRLQLISL